MLLWTIQIISRLGPWTNDPPNQQNLWICPTIEWFIVNVILVSNLLRLDSHDLECNLCKFVTKWAPWCVFLVTKRITTIYGPYKLGCVIRMVVGSILPHAECGPNDHRKDAPPFSHPYDGPLSVQRPLYMWSPYGHRWKKLPWNYLADQIF